jgi:hypothetical protein
MDSGLGIERNRWVVSDIHPDVDVRISSEVPNEAWAFESPVIPELISPGVFIGEESKMEFIESALCFEACKGFLPIDIAEWFNEF